MLNFIHEPGLLLWKNYPGNISQLMEVLSYARAHGLAHGYAHGHTYRSAYVHVVAHAHAHAVAYAHANAQFCAQKIQMHITVDVHTHMKTQEECAVTHVCTNARAYANELICAY